MRILFIKEQRCLSGIEGIGKNIIYRCIELNERGVDYLVIYNALDELYELMLANKINVIYLPFPPKSVKYILYKRYVVYKFRNKFQDLIKLHNITHIHVHNAYILDFLSKSWNVPITAHHHSSFSVNEPIRYFNFSSILKPKVFLKKFYEKLIVFNYSKSERIVAVSMGAKKTLIDKYCADKTKINVVYNGITKINVNQYKDIKNDLGFSENDKVVLSVGRITQSKGVEEFCEVAKSFSKIKDLKFVFVGGNICDEYSNNIKAKYSKWVTFTGVRSDILRFYKSSYIFLFLSHREACPNVVIESMYFKLPIIGWRVPGVSELVKDNHNGFICPFGDLDAVQKKLKVLLADNKEYQRIANNAFLEKNKYTIEENTDKIFDIFKKIPIQCVV
jgi:glycosyltransferase involved in cell wall biosynthesis